MRKLGVVSIVAMFVMSALLDNNARMRLNTWAAFTGTDADAVVAGDVAMLDKEVTPVLKALRSAGIISSPSITT